MFHRLSVWWHMWLKVRFVVYWFLCAALIPANVHYYSHLTPDDMAMFCLAWWAVSLVAIPVVEALYTFEKRVEEKVLSRKNTQKAQGGELTVHSKEGSS
jgi:hypothetical protein